MGRQTQLHMLAADGQAFLNFVQGRDPVVVVQRSFEAPSTNALANAYESQGSYYLWNKAVLPVLTPTPVRQRDDTIRYYIERDLPLIEFSYYPESRLWNGRPGLIQGRIWASFVQPSPEFQSWYNAVVRWIRKNFVKNPVPLGGFVGPAAYEWYRDGGLLLPSFCPPVTSSWLSWMEAQDQQRAVFK